MKTRPNDRAAALLLVRPAMGGSGRSVPNRRGVRPATAGNDLATRPGFFAAAKVSLVATGGKAAAAPSQATGTAAQPHAAEELLSIRKTSSQVPAAATSVTTTRPKEGGKAGARRRKPDAVKDRRPAAKRASSRKARAAASEVSKKDTVLALLRRPQGATLTELVQATGWQSHSVRGFLSGVVRKKLGLKVKSVKRESGERVYSVRA